MSIAFLDTETVTLAVGHDVLWEIGVITRDGETDREWRFQLRPNMAKADPRSLEINHFHDRYEVPTRAQAIGWSPLNYAERPARMTYAALGHSLHELLRGRSIFGICPSFDTVRLGAFLNRQLGSGYREPWHYQPHDVEDEVAGYLYGLWVAGAEPAEGLSWHEVFAVPRPTEQLAQAVGLQPDKYEKHTAIGDCRLARDLHDAAAYGNGIR